MISKHNPKSFKRHDRRLPIFRRKRRFEILAARFDTERMASTATLGACGINRASSVTQKRTLQIRFVLLGSGHCRDLIVMILQSLNRSLLRCGCKVLPNVVGGEKDFMRSCINWYMAAVETPIVAGYLRRDLLKHVSLLVVCKSQVILERLQQIVPRLSCANRPVQFVCRSGFFHLISFPNVIGMARRGQAQI